MNRRIFWISGAVVALAAASLTLGQDRPKLGFKDTPMLPGGRWHVHDGDRPFPPAVTPAGKPGGPPSDAVVLFDGKDLSQWHADKGGPAKWKVEDGALVVVGGAGSILSNDEFGDCQLHIEWASPDPPGGRDQGRGNSGVMFFGRYEVQVLDSYQAPTYADGQASAIYGQYPPLVNATKPPGQWQTYDIAFKAPRFKEDGSVEALAYLTVFHNGVLVHNQTPLIGPMTYRGLPKYSPHGPKGPILLQDHGNPVRFRNVWVRPTKAYDQP